MITTIVLARKLLNQISNYSDVESAGRHPIFDMLKNHRDGLAPLFGDWDFIKVLPPSQLSQRNDYLEEINKYYLDKRVVFGWDPDLNGYSGNPDQIEWQLNYTNKALFAYLEVQISSWVIRRMGVKGLSWVVRLIQKQLNRPEENPYQILCGLGQADILVFMFGDTYDELLEQCLKIRAITRGDLAEALLEENAKEEFASIGTDLQDSKDNHIIIETYTLFGYLPDPQHGLDFDNLDKSLAHIDDSPTTTLCPTIFVSCHPGHELSVIEKLQKKTETSMVTHSLLMPGIFDIKIGWSVDESGSIRQKRLLREVLTVVKNLCEEQYDVNGTNIVWMCGEKSFLKKCKPHKFHDHGSFTIIPFDRKTIKKIREKIGVEFADLLQELIASYNVASSHFWTRTYIRDLGLMLEEFSNWLRKTTFFDKHLDFDSLQSLEEFTNRLILVLLARKTVGVHALRSEPLYHPSLAIQKISTALNAVGHTLLKYFNAVEKDTSYLFTISPVGLAGNITLHVKGEHKKFVLHEVSPSVFFGNSFFEALHDICLLLRTQVLSVELDEAILAGVAVWLEAKYCEIFQEKQIPNRVLPLLEIDVAERHDVLQKKNAPVVLDKKQAIKEILYALSLYEFISGVARDVGIQEDLLHNPENVIKLSSLAVQTEDKIKEIRMLFEKSYADFFVAEIVGSEDYIQYLQQVLEQKENLLMSRRLLVLQRLYQQPSTLMNHDERYPMDNDEISTILSFLKKKARIFIDHIKTEKGSTFFDKLKDLCHTVDHRENPSSQNLKGFLYWWQESFNFLRTPPMECIEGEK